MAGISMDGKESLVFDSQTVPTPGQWEGRCVGRWLCMRLLGFVRASFFLTDFNSFAIVSASGWSSPVARQAHNLKVAGSNPVPDPNLMASASKHVSKASVYGLSRVPKLTINGCRQFMSDKKWIPNPDYVNAEYRMMWFEHGVGFTVAHKDSQMWKDYQNKPPKGIRYQQKGGKFVRVK